MSPDQALHIADAILTRAGRGIIGGEPLNLSRSLRPLVKRLRWARKRIRGYIAGYADASDVMDAVKAGLVAPTDPNDDTRWMHGWDAYRAAAGAREVLMLVPCFNNAD